MHVASTPLHVLRVAIVRGRYIYKIIVISVNTNLNRAKHEPKKSNNKKINTKDLLSEGVRL